MPDCSDIETTQDSRKHSSSGGLKSVQHTASMVQKSSQMTKRQQRLLFGCLKLVTEKSKNPEGRAQRSNTYRAGRVLGLLRAVHSMIGFEACLLCALSLGATKIGCMTDADATDFPGALQSWWEKASPSFSQLTKIAKELKRYEHRIANLPITNEMGESNIHIEISGVLPADLRFLIFL